MLFFVIFIVSMIVKTFFLIFSCCFLIEIFKFYKREEKKEIRIIPLARNYSPLSNCFQNISKMLTNNELQILFMIEIFLLFFIF